MTLRLVRISVMETRSRIYLGILGVATVAMLWFVVPIVQSWFVLTGRQSDMFGKLYLLFMATCIPLGIYLLVAIPLLLLFLRARYSG